MRSPKKAIEFIVLSHEEIELYIANPKRNFNDTIAGHETARFGRNIVVTVLKTCGGSLLFHILLLL